MKERDASFKEVLNDAIRTALTERPAGEPREYRQRTFPMGFRPEVALDKALAMAAALEDEEIARKLSLLK